MSPVTVHRGRVINKGASIRLSIAHSINTTIKLLVTGKLLKSFYGFNPIEGNGAQIKLRYRARGTCAIISKKSEMLY